jgi:hypothetical protein
VASKKYEEIAETFLRQVPEFAAIHQEHEAENDGETLPYVLFGGTLVMFIVHVNIQSTQDHSEAIHADDVLKRIFEFIEACASSGDEQVETLIQVGFMESLYLAGDTYPALVSHLGPASRKSLRQMEEGWEDFRNRNSDSSI